jgi:transmembrane sensor
MNPLSAPPSSHDEAALWAARLDGSVLSAADRAALEHWLAADPAHRALLSTYCQLSADLEQQLPLLAGAGDEAAEKTAGTAIPSPWWRRPAWAGATLAAAAALAVFLWPGRPQHLSTKLGTPVAERHRHALADGSVIELNAQTAVAVELDAAERRVRLAGGEAFFTVAKDPARPFYVETPAGSVRVTGTAFNVRSLAGSDLEVTVREGSVQVRPGGAAPRALRPGDRLVAAAGQVEVTSLSPGQLNDALAWRQGQVVFDGTPLREALGRFARYHGRTLTASEAAARLRVGGRYSLDDLEGFLATLEEILPVRVSRALDGTIHVGAAAET